MSPLPCPLSIRQRCHRRKRAKNTGIRITIGNAHFCRTNIAVPSNRGNSGERDRCGTIAHVLPLWSRLPIAANGNHDDIGFDLLEGLVAQAHAVNRTSRKVLDDNVSLRNELRAYRKRFRARKIELKTFLALDVQIEISG